LKHNIKKNPEKYIHPIEYKVLEKQKINKLESGRKMIPGVVQRTNFVDEQGNIISYIVAVIAS
jgi:hypothetical protein